MKPRWLDISFAARITLAFAAIAAMTVLVAVGVISLAWQEYFRSYTVENMQTMASNTALRIATAYEQAGTLYHKDVTRPAEQAVDMTSGIGIRVVDVDGNTVYDSSVANGQAGGSQQSLEPSDPDRVAYASIMVNNQPVGSVHLWVYGSDTLMRQSDLELLNNSYRAVLVAAVLAIILASLLGYLFARTLVKPINRMTKTASAIKEGDLSARTNLHGDDEIARLGETFDAMADSVEKDRALERRLTTDVAHELRTPLMAIQATVEAMIDGVYIADEERLNTVNSEVQRLSRLVDALLRLSRLENRTTPMKQEVIDVGALIETVVSAHTMFINEAGLSLSYEAQPNVLVKGDADMIRQAVANLISNAVRYTPEGGHVDIRVRKDDIAAAISVRDTGIGLSKEEVRMVFSRFWRADSGRDRESGGLGVGLAVVKEIVERHGGWVLVEGEKGKGACFTIHIPLYKPELDESNPHLTRANVRQIRNSQRLIERERRKSQTF